jgi:hypothetical protein
MQILIRYMKERLRIVDEIRIQDPKTRTLLEGTNLNGLNTVATLNCQKLANAKCGRRV